jgi:hypothetical protein
MKSRAALVCVFGLASVCFATDEPKQKPENTLHLELAEAVKPQEFPRPVTFFVDKVVDRSGNAQPHLVLKARGGVFIDQEPTDIMRAALEQSLKAGAILATDKKSADYVLDVYLFNFGLSEGSGFEYYGRVEMNIVTRSKDGKSQQITAVGTSLGNGAVRKKNVQKNLKSSLEVAIQAALRNFLRGSRLREMVVSSQPPEATP